MRVLVAGGVDALCVLLFVGIGRATHHEEDGVAGYAGTVWPFLVALAAGWLIGRVWRRPETLAAGAVVWAATLAGGMALRAASGDGTAPAFVVVAAVFLALTLLGWRAAARIAAAKGALWGASK
ncbi:MAG TPA: DUF3054 domain-containing protein [Spirillospora sp.]